MRGKKVVLMGGGFSGLWLGAQLIRRGYDIELLEKEEEVGGLLRSQTINGFTLDLGPHIYFPSHKSYYESYIDKPLQLVSAFYGFAYRGRQIRSPITPRNLYRSLPLKDTFLLGSSFLLNQLRFFSPNKDFLNAEEWAVRQYGRLAYRGFFQDYIPKVTGMSADRVSHEWGTERTRFYKQHNLFQKSLRLVKQIFEKSDGEDGPLKLYYAPNGSQRIAQGLSRFITDNGGSVRTGSSIKRVELYRNRAVKCLVSDQGGREEEVRGDYYINTVPITEFIKMIHAVPPVVLEAANALKFRHLRCLYYVVHRTNVMDKMQIYFPEKKYIFKRVYEDPSFLFSPSGRTAVCAEICYSPGDALSQAEGKEVGPLVREQLCSFYKLREKELIDESNRDAQFAYAVYEKGYLEHLHTIAEFLYNIDSLLSFGRSGLFRYNFLTDLIIDAARTVLRYLESNQSKHEFLRSADPKGDFL